MYINVLNINVRFGSVILVGLEVKAETELKKSTFKMSNCYQTVNKSVWMVWIGQFRLIWRIFCYLFQDLTSVRMFTLSLLGLILPHLFINI